MGYILGLKQSPFGVDMLSLARHDVSVLICCHHLCVFQGVAPVKGAYVVRSDFQIPYLRASLIRAWFLIPGSQQWAKAVRRNLRSRVYRFPLSYGPSKGAIFCTIHQLQTAACRKSCWALGGATRFPRRSYWPVQTCMVLISTNGGGDMMLAGNSRDRVGYVGGSSCVDKE